MSPIITKNCFFGIIVLLSLAFFFACKKETPTIMPPIDPCAQNYELYSKPYVNIFKGSYSRGCVITPTAIYVDKYQYDVLGVNPKNKYEICFLRRLNSIPGTRYYDLLSYSFCTNKTTLIAEKVKKALDWSVQDYFIFVSDVDDKVYRIKANGDSLTQLPNVAEFYKLPKWSPNGTKIVLNNNTVIDAKGNNLPKLPFNIYTTYAWESDSTLFYCSYDSDKDDFKIFRYNFNTKINQLFYTEPKNGIGHIFHFSAKNSTIYGFVQDKPAQYNYFAIDTKTLQKKLLATSGNGFAQYVAGTFENQLLATFDMRDTVSGQICKFKQRNHIALMNFDGTNERQVLIPE
jgi:hypothetical protein